MAGTGRRRLATVGMAGAALALGGAPVLLAGPPALASTPAGATTPVTLTAPTQPSVVITSPPAGGSSGSPAVVTSSAPTVAGRATPGDQNGFGSIESPVQVDFVSLAGHPVFSSFTLPAQAATTGGRSWAFSGTPPASLTWNGTYQVSVTAKETDRNSLGQTTQGTTTTSQTFALAAPPIAPRDVTATVVRAGAVTAKGAAAPARAGTPATTSTTSASGAGPWAVQVSWTANPEPDITGYSVLRSTGSGGWQALATSATPGYLDKSVATGQSYRYAVVAEREGATSTQTISSSPSATGTLTVSTAGASAPPSPVGPFTGAFNPTLPTPSLPSASTSGGSGSASSAPVLPAPAAPITGSPTYGNFQSVLPYVTLPGQHGASGTSASLPSSAKGGTNRSTLAVGGGLASKSTPASSSRARTFATVALAMILLAAAAHLRRLFKAVSADPAPAGGGMPLAPDEVGMVSEPAPWGLPGGLGRSLYRDWGRGA